VKAEGKIIVKIIGMGMEIGYSCVIKRCNFACKTTIRNVLIYEKENENRGGKI